MIDFYDITRYKLTEIATIERPKKGKIYPKGTVYIQVSATDGQVGILGKAAEVENKNVVVTPEISILPMYFKIAIEQAMPEFRTRYQSTINIQVDTFRYFDICIHNDMQTQAYVVAMVKQADKARLLEEKLVDAYKSRKKYYLDKMFT